MLLNGLIPTTRAGQKGLNVSDAIVDSMETEFGSVGRTSHTQGHASLCFLATRYWSITDIDKDCITFAGAATVLVNELWWKWEINRMNRLNSYDVIMNEPCKILNRITWSYRWVSARKPSLLTHWSCVFLALTHRYFLPHFRNHDITHCLFRKRLWL